MKFDKDYFNKENFNRGRKMTFYDIAYSKLIDSFKKRNLNILEIGCSHGHLLSLLENSYTTTGIEISRYAFKQASKNTKKSKLIYLDFTKNNRSFKEKFDLILAIDVFEHFRDPEKIIKKCYNLLSNRGSIIIKIPNKSSLILKILKIFKKEKKWSCYKDPTHYSVSELNEWINLFQKANFSVEIKASPATNLLKKIFANNPNIFFSKINQTIFNETITLIAQKNEN